MATPPTPVQTVRCRHLVESWPSHTALANHSFSAFPPPSAECDATKLQAPKPADPVTWDTAYGVSMLTGALSEAAELLNQDDQVGTKVLAKVGLGLFNGERRAFEPDGGLGREET